MIRFSASALKRFAACPRSWRYSRDVEPVEKASTKLGKETHAWLEDYMRTSTPPDMKPKHAKIVLPGLKYIADIPRGGVAKLEQHFTYTIDGITLHGFIDLLNVPLVLDHKTSSDVEKYALTVEQLETDYQRISYAESVHSGVDDEGKPLCSSFTPEVTCRWVYYGTRKRYSEQREITEKRKATRERMGDVVLPLARKLLPLWDAPAADFDRDLRRCEDYGGCPFQDKCWKDDPPSRAERAKGAEMSTTLERLKAKRAAEAAAAGAAPPAASETVPDVSFSPDQKPAAGAAAPKSDGTPSNAAPSSPPAGPPASKPSDGTRTPPKKRGAGSKVESDDYTRTNPGPVSDPALPDTETPIVIVQAQPKLPMHVVLQVVAACRTAADARDMLQVVADWAGDA